MIQVGQYDTYETPPDMQQIHGCPVPAKPPKESVVELIPRAASVVVTAIQQENGTIKSKLPVHSHNNSYCKHENFGVKIFCRPNELN